MENSAPLQASATASQKTGKSRRGFASMDRQRHKEVSSKGGKAIRTNYASRNAAPSPLTAVSPLN